MGASLWPWKNPGLLRQMGPRVAEGTEGSSAEASTSWEAYVDMEGTLLAREHLVPPICQLVPSTFISLRGSSHSAACSLHGRKVPLRMAERPA